MAASVTKSIPEVAEGVNLGAFGRDLEDIQPMSLLESAHESYLWKVVPSVPECARQAYPILRQRSGLTRPQAVEVLKTAGITR